MLNFSVDEDMIIKIGKTPEYMEKINATIMKLSEQTP